MDNNSTMLYKQPCVCSAVNTGRKNGFAQICSWQICGKNSKTEFKINLTQTPRFFFGMQKIFAPDLLLSFAFCDIDTVSNFVQIHFFVQLNCLRKCQHGFQLRNVFFTLLQAR